MKSVIFAEKTAADSLKPPAEPIIFYLKYSTPLLKIGCSLFPSTFFAT